MTAHVYSATNIGFEGNLIEVECDASVGLPTLTLVGLGNKAIDEARERVRSAIKNSGLEFPRKRITVNLAPASLPKDGAHFDLAIALALLCVSGQIKQDVLSKLLAIGELGLDGSLRPVRGVIGHLETAKRIGLEVVIIPTKNYQQASLITGIRIVPAGSLREVMGYLSGTIDITLPVIKPPLASKQRLVSLSDIQGQEQAKRALLIAAAGHHNILLDGPPGSGKTMLAKSLISLLPPLSPEEVIATTKLHSIAGETDEQVIIERPFRSPHHSASHIALIGGGAQPKPGEISLAHCGVLLLDELPEYSRASLEALRQPLEDKEIHIARTHSRITYPTNFMLVATQNPCPCGFANDQTRECTCSALQVQQYQKKVSGPLLDRIDLHIQVSRAEVSQLLDTAGDETNYRKLIADARLIQAKRLRSPGRTNATLNNQDIRIYARLTKQANQLLNHAAEKLNVSARSYFKIIKVSRTIADLAASEEILPVHISESLQYRTRQHSR